MVKIHLENPAMCQNYARKCLGSGLNMADSGTGWIVPAMHTSKCMVCNGKGWLPDDSNTT